MVGASLISSPFINDAQCEVINYTALQAESNRNLCDAAPHSAKVQAKQASTSIEVIKGCLAPSSLQT